MNSSFFQLLVRWSVLALGVTLATKLVNGITCDDGATLIAVVLLLSLLNAVLKPLLVLFSLPFIVLTLGLGMVVINALLFLLVAQLVNGFHVADFWAALWGALIVSITNLVLSTVIGKKPRGPGGAGVGRTGGAPASREKLKTDDVIDI